LRENSGRRWGRGCAKTAVGGGGAGARKQRSAAGARGRSDADAPQSREETRGDEGRRPAREIREDRREDGWEGGWGEEEIGEERGRKGTVEERAECREGRGKKGEGGG
jgi:hypothetical protein